MHQLQPTVGQWYARTDNGHRFEVVSLDEEEGTIELQDEDGSLDEVDNESWFALDIEDSAPPEDLTAVFDDADRPDESDGGDPMPPVITHTDFTQTARMAREEMVNAAEPQDADGDWDKGMEAPPPTEEEHYRSH